MLTYFYLNITEKHGTCSYPVVENESDFFSTALNIFFKYNVTEALFKAGYAPSNSEKYPLGGIISAIQNAFYMTPEVVCSGEALKELRLCFYKNFEPRDCATESRIESGMISLKTSSCPSYVSLSVHEASQCNRLMDWISLKLNFAVSLLVYLSMRRG
ncbi:unnamed protein product [Cuscuta campestris]|uniref:Uncharacterized protein n=1 Tax=Cuscuta campestris TaxID=132261 RepID=A0A484N3V5_9ASTE|nr:unnamed protein product [Cuscuta campestris]